MSMRQCTPFSSAVSNLTNLDDANSRPTSVYPCSFLSTYEHIFHVGHGLLTDSHRSLNSRDNIRRAFDAEITCPGLQSMVLHSDNHDKDLGSSGEDVGRVASSGRPLSPLTYSSTPVICTIEPIRPLSPRETLV